MPERGEVRVLGVIPARYGSTRFPGKPLAQLGGKALVLHAVDRARESAALSRLVVATDHEDIARVVQGAGVETRLTPATLPSGSDRVAHVLRDLEGEGDEFDVVLNIQGDEPFLPGEAMDRAVEILLADPEAVVATLAAPASEEEMRDPNVVKVVLGSGGQALYFSRAPVPFPAGTGATVPLKHVGLYAYRGTYLKRFVGMTQSRLERTEKLEQLRALEDGARIAVGVGAWSVLAVDTPQDLDRAEARLRSR